MVFVSRCGKQGSHLSVEITNAVSEEQKQSAEPVVIKKYANRRLYNTDTSSYVTLDDLAEMVRAERDFVVYDAKTGEDLTHSVLTQIIVEQESRGENLLPISFLRQLIRFYGDNMGRLIPSYLDFSLTSLTREQDRYRKQFANAFGASALDAMQEQAKQNMALFEKALGMFNPFAPPEAGGGAAGGNSVRDREEAERKEKADKNGDDIEALKDQLSAMQDKLDQLSRRSS
jgi:polyhydroxyalkanoate synthesis repressor PhaR